jgi:hypothetical protein
MVTTRSKSKTAASVNEPKRSATNHSNKADKKSGTKKRKGEDTSSETPPPTKRSMGVVKKEDSSKRSRMNGDSNILINRSPVLQLWSACVAHFIYPQLPWDTCLSAGSAISTICAVAKGRSIGTIESSDITDDKKRKREEAKEKNKGLHTIDVMHFHLKLKDGRALVGSQGPGKPAAEEPLRKKFGEKEYAETRKVFGECLQYWKGKEKELNQKAFGFYEHFRPQVSGGQKGWGRKGELSLEKVRSTIVEG